MRKGAELLAGGRARPDLGPYFYEPTLLAGVTEEMELCRAETFGPVAAVYRCSSVDEMVARANDSEYGLNASVWTRDVKAGREIAGAHRDGHRQRQRGLRGHLGVGGADGRLEAVGARSAATGATASSSTPTPQTVAVEHVLNIGTPPFLSHGQYAAVMTQAVRLLKHVPGIK